jgi:hypothetical protein
VLRDGILHRHSIHQSGSQSPRLAILPQYVHTDVQLVLKPDPDTVFSVFCYSYFPIVYCFYPETAQRTLEDMDEIFRSNPHAFVFGDKDLVRRRRPQKFIDAEILRTQHASVDTSDGKGAVVHVEGKSAV